MKNISLKQLRYFEVLARVGHFGQAADLCAVTQPALSVQIKALEAAAGAALFERTTREVRLTGLGVEFAERVKEILRSVDELSDLARKAQEGLSGRLRLGVIPTIAPYLLPQFLTRLHGAFPDLDVQVRESITPRLISELGEGGLDLAIVALPVSERSLEEMAVFDEAMVLIRPLAESEDEVPEVTELHRRRLLLLEEGHCFRDQALSFCNIPGGGPRDGLEGTSLSTLVQMVGAGMGITLIPEMAVPVETRSAPVSVGRFRAPEPTRRVGMVWRRTSPLAARFREIAKLLAPDAPDLSAQ
ncbi:MAG: LysR substrate-binding domain-containing protein [Roseovarius sp.]